MTENQKIISRGTVSRVRILRPKYKGVLGVMKYPKMDTSEVDLRDTPQSLGNCREVPHTQLEYLTS